MAFAGKTWENAPDGYEEGDALPPGATPLDADGLNDLEARIAAGLGEKADASALAAKADAAATTAALAAKADAAATTASLATKANAASLAAKLDAAVVGQPNGVAPLDGTGRVPSSMVGSTSSAAAGAGPSSFVGGDTPGLGRNVVKSRITLFAESSQANPPQVRPVEPTRIVCRITNLGTNNLKIGFSSNASNNFSAPGSYPDTVLPGQTWESGGNKKAIFVAPVTDTQIIPMEIYTELGAAI